MFQETIVQINNGAAVAELSDALRKVVASVRETGETGKSGSITLTLKVAPASKGNADVLLIESQVKTKLPEPERGMTIFYATDNNLLVRNDPKQQMLPLRVVEFDQPRDLREVKTMPYNDDNSKIGDVQSAIAADAALGDPRAIPESPVPVGFYTVVPEHYKIESLEDFMPRPLRIQQKVELHDAASFIAYVGEFGDHEVSRIFFDQEHEQFQVVIDYHGGNGVPGWCEHIAGFAARRSVEFTTWMNQNRKQMTQVDFARFLEDNMPDVVEPNSAELLQVALTFEAKKSVEFSSGVRLNNGQIQFAYDEVVRGAAQKGTLEVPEQFILGIPIHVGGPAYRIPVRFRWRLQEGKAVFWYEVGRPHRFIEEALREIRERIGQETGLDVLAGVAK